MVLTINFNYIPSNNLIHSNLVTYDILYRKCLVLPSSSPAFTVEDRMQINNEIKHANNNHMLTRENQHHVHF